MFGHKVNELHPPPAAEADREAVEIARIWVASGDQHVVLRPDVWEDPAAWGILLVDLARHAARTYHQSEGHDLPKTLSRIKAGFDAEWGTPTDEPTGGLRS